MRNGILAVWSGIDPEVEDDYSAWYEREHMFERLEVPGLHRARHYRTAVGAPKYFTYFELDSPQVVSSDAYLSQANNSSPWTQRVLPHFRDVNRTAARVVRRLGRGFGAAAMTVRLANPGDDGHGLIKILSDHLLPAVVERPGIMAAQLWQADPEATWQPGQDRDLRPQPDEIAYLVIFVEGTEVEPLRAVVDDAMSAIAAASMGAAAPPVIAIHQLLNGAESSEAPPI